MHIHLIALALMSACDAPRAPVPSAELSEPAVRAAAPATVEAAAPVTAEPAGPVPLEVRAPSRDLTIWSSPSAAGRPRGTLKPQEPFPVFERVDGAGCGGDGWARINVAGAAAYACLADTAATDGSPVMLPRLVRFDPPEPSEWEVYVETGAWKRDAVASSEALLPYIYGKQWRRWRGPLFASREAFERGDAPVASLGGNHKYHFVSAVDSGETTLLVRDDGKVSPADQVFLYPVTRFHGWDLVAEPVPEGTLPGWAVAYQLAPLRDAPSAEAPVVRSAAYGERLVVRPADAARVWWEVVDGLGPGVPGYLALDRNYPLFRFPELVAGPALGADELWIDVDVRQQVMTVFRGAVPVYATMVATGESLPTPHGLFRIFDKAGYGDMEGRPDADYDPYYVEKVPWVMHFAPRYALHGVYWHWGFGHTASHGCVNLAPLDAKWVYEHVTPTVEPGWIAAWETAEDPGTLVRIRNGEVPVRDRRLPLPD
jgi:hypothetical protein